MLIRWNFRIFFFKSREFVIFVPRDTLMIELVHVNVLFIYLFILPGFIAVPIYVYLSIFYSLAIDLDLTLSKRTRKSM